MHVANGFTCSSPFINLQSLTTVIVFKLVAEFHGLWEQLVYDVGIKQEVHKIWISVVMLKSSLV